MSMYTTFGFIIIMITSILTKTRWLHPAQARGMYVFTSMSSIIVHDRFYALLFYCPSLYHNLLNLVSFPFISQNMKLITYLVSTFLAFGYLTCVWHYVIYQCHEISQLIPLSNILNTWSFLFLLLFNTILHLFLISTSASIPFQMYLHM